MIKKAINLKETSFTQAINISAQWCKEWGEDLLSEEVLADRVAELIKTKNGLRGFFAYALSDQNCYLLDKLPFSFVFKLQEAGNEVVEIVVKNLIMSSAQIIVHENYEKQITNCGTVMLFFSQQKIIKSAKAHIFLAKDDHFVLHEIFAKYFACNEAHQNHKTP